MDRTGNSWSNYFVTRRVDIFDTLGNQKRRKCNQKTKITKEYDLINLSNILSYHFNKNSLQELINYLNTKFSLTQNGEIINYIFNISNETIELLNTLLQPNGYIENKKILVYKK